MEENISALGIFRQPWRALGTLAWHKAHIGEGPSRAPKLAMRTAAAAASPIEEHFRAPLDAPGNVCLTCRTNATHRGLINSLQFL